MERETKIKVFGTAFFIILLMVLSYLIYKSNEVKRINVIEKVHVTGNKLLAEKDYLNFTKLNNSQVKGLTLPVIKDRFEKHPYVLRADVKFINEKEVQIFVTEKKIYGVIIKEPDPLFISENF